MRRRTIWILAAALVPLVGLFLCWVLLWRTPSPVRAYESIRLGMTPEEVEAIIGKQPERPLPSISLLRLPPDARSVRQKGLTLTARDSDVATSDRNAALNLEGKSWPLDDYWLFVAFQERRVVSCYLIDTAPASPSGFLDRLRAWLGL
jgi:hypothetical protein